MEHEIKWRSTDGETTRGAVERVESQLGVRFPEDYVECAIKNHGGIPSYDVFDIDGQSMEFNRLLSFDPDEGQYFLSVFSRIRDRLVDHVYPFASDSFGNFICFDYRKGKDKSPTIAFWDHEEAFLDKEKGVVYICDSFGEFLSKLRPYQG